MKIFNFKGPVAMQIRVVSLLMTLIASWIICLLPFLELFLSQLVLNQILGRDFAIFFLSINNEMLLVSKKWVFKVRLANTLFPFLLFQGDFCFNCIWCIIEFSVKRWEISDAKTLAKVMIQRPVLDWWRGSDLVNISLTLFFNPAARYITHGLTALLLLLHF